MAFQFQQPAIVQSSRVAFPKAELYVPVVSGLRQPAAQTAINNKIRQTERQLVQDQGSLADPRAEMIGYFEIKTNEKNVLSLSLFNYAYTGGAHGLTLQESLTFDAATGKAFTLAELFKPGSDYVKRLSDLVRAQIAERQIETFEPFKAIRPDQPFYIADRALVIYFALYEITPYAFGFPYFPISVYDVSDIVNPNGPLGRMDAND
ncbi:DUF3298 and DUF4163 domain-containing protein [Paenibacillus sp. MWE-103]|uniref:DUF3298 and DUF4163 domain-containing protein n=1 Tax=Paenibacillus artemisiicola TaxID=1172618 RepID=A0ABS3WCK1_9BACL|nr:DUF3298 and DUF4163 domain-containing protein [Paenibacillus artemisiicola]MBO7746007.1 DUF3298 and DUF4163 domain-containing protein [Paenibacillus artemisiicola]